MRSTQNTFRRRPDTSSRLWKTISLVLDADCASMRWSYRATCVASPWFALMTFWFSMISTAAAAALPTVSCTSSLRTLMVLAAESTNGVSTGAEIRSISARTQFRYSSTPMMAIVSRPDRIPRAPSSLVTCRWSEVSGRVRGPGRDLGLPL